MDAVDAILKRRSVRAGGHSPIPRATIELVLECGNAAPSSKNARPWRFHVLDDRTELAEIADEMLTAEGVESFVPLDPATGLKRTEWESTVAESAETLRSASAAIVVENLGAFSYSRRVLARVPRELLEDALLGYSLEMIGHGTAIENMWIAAASLGLAASFMGDVLVVEDSLKRRLAATGDIVGLLALRQVEPQP